MLNRLSPIAGRTGRWFSFDHQGQNFVLWIDSFPDSLQDIIQSTGDFYEVEALQLIRDILPPKARIVDVGANIGNHAVYFDRVCGAEKVFVIEPNADVLIDLRANAAANHCGAIDFSMAGFAVGEQAGIGTLVISASDDAIRNRGGMSVSEGGPAAGQTVPIRRLDDLDLGQVDFLKIDVEGGALDVLLGARALLARCRPSIFVEIDVPDLPAFSAWIRDSGYEVSAAVEYHLGIVNFLLVAGSDAMLGTTARTVPLPTVGGQHWSAMLAEKRRADRSEDTLAISIVAMRNADARATGAETRATDAETRATDAETRATDAETRATDAEARATNAEARAKAATALAAEHLAALHRMGPDRSLWQRLFFRASGKPKKAVRKLLFHSAGRPRGVFRSYVLHNDGRPRDAFYRWMTSLEYLALPDQRRTSHTRFVAHETRPESHDKPVPMRFLENPRRVLFIDHDYPDPNRDSGSVDTINYVTWLAALGYEVVYLSTAYKADSTAEEPVIAAGARVLHLSEEQAVTEHLRNEGYRYGLFFLSRVYCGGLFLEACRMGNPRANIVFNTVDLHHLREDREARLRQDREAMFRAQSVRERELYVARQSDLTIVVSSLEKDILAEAVPGLTVAVMPLFRELPAKIAEFDARIGIGFVGGYGHAPNVDAVQYFLAEVWPLLHAADPCLRFELAGLGLPEDIAQSLPDSVIYKGQVVDLEGWLDGLRLTVVPLRYGAGAKGKVASSIVNGVPVIGTRVAFEGMGVGADASVVADDPVDMAREILRLHSDKAAWESLSRGARAFGVANLSPDAGQVRFAALLAALPGAARSALAPHGN